MHESSYYCGSAIVGAKGGMLSSYAISVMVLHIFNKYSNLTHPFSVLRSFLYTYLSFPWDSHVLTIDGAVPISSIASSGGYSSGYSVNSAGRQSVSGLDGGDAQSVTSHNSAGSAHSGRARGGSAHFIQQQAQIPSPSQAPFDSSNRFQIILDSLAKHPALQLYQQAGNMVHHGRFTAKACNIQDPVDPCNNLGISVPRPSLQLITQACQGGFNRLETLLRRYPHAGSGNNNSLSGVAAVDGMDYSFSAQQQQYDTNNYKYSGSKVKQMLKPVAPGNLGYLGTVVPGHINGVNTPNNANYEYSTQQQQDGMFTDTNMHINNGSGHISGANSTASTPFRRNSRTTSAAMKPSFLTDFFPVSLGLYCSAEGEPLRCDLLNHPLQPLSTSSLLANPYYVSARGDNSSQNAGRVKTTSFSVYDAVGQDAQSVTSIGSGATDLISATVSDSLGTPAGMNVPTGSPQQGPHGDRVVADPLEGDLQSMYDALDMFVAGRRQQSSTRAPAAMAPVKKSPVVSAQNSVSSASMTSALPMEPKRSSESSLPLTSLSSKIIPDVSPHSAGIAYKRSFAAPAVEVDRNAHSSPSGSTTSGTNTDSPRLRADTSISISSDSSSASECAGEEPASEAEGESEGELSDSSDRVARKRPPSRKPAKVKADARTSTLMSTTAAAGLTDAAQDTVERNVFASLYAPVGSVMAFFRERNLVDMCAALPAHWAASLQELRLAHVGGAAPPTDCAEEALSPISDAPSIIVSAQNIAGKGKSSARQAATSPVERGIRNKSAAVVAAAVKGRSKRTVTSWAKRAYQSALTWLEARWLHFVTQYRLLRTKQSLLQMPLVVALVYSILMIIVIDQVLKSGLISHGKYAQLLRITLPSSDQYVHKYKEINDWLRGAGSYVQNVLRRPPPVARDPEPLEEAPASQYDFSFSKELGAFSGFGALRSDPDSAFEYSIGWGISLPPANRAAHSSATAPLHVTSHWVKEGESISFGDFGTYGAGSSGAASTHKAATTASPSDGDVPSLVATHSPSAPTSRSTASSASAAPKEVRTVPSEYVQKTQYVPKAEYVLATSAVVGTPFVYQWTKDGANITNNFYHNQPYFSIKRTRMEDAGHYRCFRYDVAIASAAPLMVMETVIQISSKCLFFMYICEYYW